MLFRADVSELQRAAKTFRRRSIVFEAPVEFAFHGVKQVVRLGRSRCGIAAMASSPAWVPATARSPRRGSRR